MILGWIEAQTLGSAFKSKKPAGGLPGGHLGLVLEGWLRGQDLNL
ncbi:hypothetical protein [Mesorhizobium sp. AR07]|nr:hypothetical protein [Mesorhizobium sp. AR07]